MAPKSAVFVPMESANLSRQQYNGMKDPRSRLQSGENRRALDARFVFASRRGPGSVKFARGRAFILLGRIVNKKRRNLDLSQGNVRVIGIPFSRGSDHAVRRTSGIAGFLGFRRLLKIISNGP